MCPRRSSDCSIAEFELNYRTGSGSDVAVLVPLNESLCAAQRPGRYTARTDECVRVDLATAQLPNLSSTTEQEAVATWPFRNTQALVEWHRNGQVATASCSVVEFFIRMFNLGRCRLVMGGPTAQNSVTELPPPFCVWSLVQIVSATYAQGEN